MAQKCRASSGFHVFNGLCKCCFGEKERRSFVLTLNKKRSASYFRPSNAMLAKSNPFCSHRYTGDLFIYLYSYYFAFVISFLFRMVVLMDSLLFFLFLLFVCAVGELEYCWWWCPPLHWTKRKPLTINTIALVITRMYDRKTGLWV